MDNTLFHDVSYGMYVITTKYNGQNVGCIANTFCQITRIFGELSQMELYELDEIIKIRVDD